MSARAVSDGEAYLNLKATPIDDIADQALLERRERVTIPPEQWNAWAPEVHRLTNVAPTNGAFRWSGIWFDRAEGDGAMTEHPTGDTRNTLMGDYIPDPPVLREVAATIHDAEREVYQMTGLDHLTAPAPTMPSGTWEDRTDGYSRAIAHMRLARLHPRKVRSTAMVTSETATAMRLHRDRMEQMTADREERRAVRRTWRRWFRWWG